MVNTNWRITSQDNWLYIIFSKAAHPIENMEIVNSINTSTISSERFAPNVNGLEYLLKSKY